MSGTKAGGQKAAATNKAKWGEDFYSRIGKDGGKNGNTGGFFYAKIHLPESDPAHPKNAGMKGGKISRKGVKLHSAPKDSKVTTELGEQYEEVVSEVHAPSWLRDTAHRLGHVIPRNHKTKSTSTSDRR